MQYLKYQVIAAALLGLALLFGAAPGWAKEAGAVRGLTVWEGEVTFSRTVEVPPDATLEIRPGTLVRPLTPEAGIRVRGVLRVIGSQASPVRFASPPQWVGIEFAEGPAGSLIEHADFQGATAAVSSSFNAFTLRHSRFSNCRTAVKLLRQSNPRIENCRFENNDLGVDIEMKSAPELVGNRFLGHRQAAVLATHNSAGVVEKNLFKGNLQGVRLLRAVLVQVRGNEFRDNETGIYCEQTRETPVIRDNRFFANKYALVNFSFSSPTVENNLFADNDTAVRNDQLGIPRLLHNHFRGNRVALDNLRRSAPEVRSNLLEANQVAIICDYSSYPRVTNNNFLGNRMGVKLGMNQSAERERLVDSGGLVQATAASRQGPYPRQPQLQSEFDDFVDVRGNWWGADTAQLAAAGAEGNVPIFFDRRDQPRVRLAEPGSASYLIDRVEYAPWLEGPAAGAGLREALPR
ncbi:hypothetical protein DESUT3_30090 [Desulfuromonas versatilis]|uniref:Right handed beta helix domain-containing protein n=2 Tax=Desulfuromonas versatilis TaxID=2802975 RepID=A0ABN6E0U3_9BACT|nr:hypothetical protein DESUT3_30090 [Desulfuromonas versatilis]